MRALPILASGIVLVGLSAGPAAAADQGKAKATERLRMSISTTLFDGMSEQLIVAMMQPFRALMKMQTGLEGEFISTGDGLTIGEKLMEGKLNLAVMEGIEFAWAREKNPELKPILIAVNQKPYMRSYLVVKKGGAKKLADLKGKTLVNYRYTRVFSHLYLDRACKELANVPHREFFGKTVKKDFAEEMLDDVIDGQADAAIIEEVCFDCYQRRKPARFKELTVIGQSERFPASVVCYRAGKLDNETLRRLRTGMLDAGSSPLGRQLMTLWQMTAFENVPVDYDAHLKEIIKLYPAPEKSLAVSKKDAPTKDMGE